MTARRRTDGLINDDNAAMIAAARGRSETELLNLLAGEIGQVAAAMLCGRSQSWASRHLNGEAGLIKNRNFQLEYNRRKRALKTPPIDPELLARLLAERLAVEMRPHAELIADAITQAGRAIAVKIDSATASEKRR